MKKKEENDDNLFKLINKSNDDDNELQKIIKNFSNKLNFMDDFIEKILNDLLISDDLNDNEINITRILIVNLKKTNFSEIKFLYFISFVNSVKKLIDNIQGKDFKIQFLIKSLSFIISTISIDLSVEQFINIEECDIDELLTYILNIYSEKISYKLLKSINKNDISDIENIKHQYESNIELILKINKSFIKVIYHYIKLINFMVTLYLIPILYDSNGLTIIAFIKTTFLNLYSLFLFNTIYKRCELNKCEHDKELNHGSNIEYFFNNLDKIVEGNNGNLNEELYILSKKLFDHFNKNYFKKTFKFVAFADERRSQTQIYNLLETVISLFINNTYLLLGADKFKTYFDGFANNKIEYKELLKTTENLTSILNCKKYKVDNKIKWNNNCDYVFTLKDVSIEYNLKSKNDINDTINDDINLTIANNVTINFEKNKFHFISGDSGSGKSTLFKVILSKHKIKEGEIKFLGIYENYNYLRIIEHVTVILSDSILFPKSLYFNLTYKINDKILKNKNDEIINTIIKYMNIFGLETYIPNLKTKNAKKLSKGQTQKINFIYCILNIMFSNTKIVFLDEPTSNIDEHTEEKIFKELKLLQNTYPFTCLYISHNSSNYKFADCIYHVSSESKSITKNIIHTE